MNAKVVKVRVLDKNLQLHNGLFMHVGVDKAIRGEAAGIWAIVTEDDYENKSMSSADMQLKTTAFSRGLNRKNLFH